jgi:hypothetical protein
MNNDFSSHSYAGPKRARFMSFLVLVFGLQFLFLRVRPSTLLLYLLLCGRIHRRIFVIGEIEETFAETGVNQQ